MTNEPFNKLTDAEAERLAMLIEECGEVIQAATKVLRHGYESFHPDELQGITMRHDAQNNRDRLTAEMCDLFAVYDLMDGDFGLIDAADRDEAFARKLAYSHHQEAY
jgi:NTP pyrophosphatase (non-canonical NTP hydrolase)